jgi:hypothetical protein
MIKSIKQSLSKTYGLLSKKLEPNIDYFLENINGVVHIGANRGQERKIYEKFQLNVLWIEPIPSVFNDLQKNIEGINKQIALNNLVTDEDDQQYRLNISSNAGLSSSIMVLKEHSKIWPKVTFKDSITLHGLKWKPLILNRMKIVQCSLKFPHISKNRGFN